MPEILASTYEILQKIGAGGGGEVYLAYHQRLGKKVVLKADKRSLSTRADLLRREADVLKNLNHPYIPKVYDIFVENETVYTVIDYIEGESLDRPLKRGECFPQPQIVKWAMELLEALDYLHQPIHGDPPRGYVHGDVKPANLMLRSNGEISLIDFNIALAIGEETLIGGSAGYASPEHFGLDYSFSNTSRTPTAVETVADDDQTRTLNTQAPPTSQRRVVPDARSDVYSAGATLYHLLSGRKPARDATQVIPLSTMEASEPIVKIISKAMNPNPDLRYQTAGEMLAAFQGLWKNDPRSRQLRRAKRIAAAILCLTAAAGAALGFVGMRRMNAVQEAQLLAAQAETALEAGEKEAATRLAMQAVPEKADLLTPPATAQAYRALADALGVYDVRGGLKLEHTITLPSEALRLRLSPDGSTCAASSLGKLTVFDTATGRVLCTLDSVDSAQTDMVFLDEQTLVYAGSDGVAVYDLKNNETRWSGEAAARIAVSANGASIAAASPDGTRAVIYTPDGMVRRQIDFEGRTTQTVSNTRFADAQDMLFCLNAEGTFLAVSFADGTLEIYDVAGQQDIELLDPSDYSHFEGGFSGDYFAFSATDEVGSLFAVIDLVEMDQTGGFELPSRIGVRTDENAIYISNDYTLVQIDPVSGEQTELAFTNSLITDFLHTPEHTLVMTQDGGVKLFNKAAEEENYEILSCRENTYAAMWDDGIVLASLNSPLVQLLRFDEAAESVLMHYAPGFAHNEARINQAGTAAMLYSYQAFRLVSADGTVLKEYKLPDAEHIYDQQYYKDADGSRLEVIYEDGTVDVYSGDTGEKIASRQEPKPDESLNETFETERYRIESPLHGTPVVYDRQSGKQLGELERDGYLTYVTQVGQYILTEYIDDDGTRWGLLLNERLETLAELPQLCDTWNGKLLFDDELGTLRQSRIYSIEELLQIAKEELEESSK